MAIHSKTLADADDGRPQPKRKKYETLNSKVIEAVQGYANQQDKINIGGHCSVTFPTRSHLDIQWSTNLYKVIGGHCSVTFPTRSHLDIQWSTNLYKVNCRYLSTSHKHEAKSASGSRPEACQSANMMDIGTRRIFNEEHDIFRQTARRFMADEVVPHHPKWEEEGQVSREVWEKAGKMGFLGIDTPEEHGGLGGDFITSSVVMEEQSYANCSGLGWPLHSHIVMPYISHYGSKEQIEKFIPNMTAGKCIGAIAMTEPGAGSDLQGVRTNAKKDGSDYILNGSKVYITNGYMSDVVIVVAITNPNAKTTAHGISLFLVEEGMKGFVKGKKLKKMGLKAQVFVLF
ncbi:hypothetical protein Btru_028661 [Bulinus truncatus]|nr:hypothetical protein Btru_028661 [Bulinus truncatus]